MSVEDDSKFEIVEHRKEQQRLAVEEALGEVGLIKTKLGSLGANDVEIPQIDKIIEDLKSGNIDPNKAKELAIKIIGSKMDYH
jgi:hypothetical protein